MGVRFVGYRAMNSGIDFRIFFFIEVHRNGHHYEAVVLVNDVGEDAVRRCEI